MWSRLGFSVPLADFVVDINLERTSSQGSIALLAVSPQSTQQIGELVADK